jgi:CRP-like cAMP-binding protein
VRRRLRPHLERVRLEIRQPLYESHQLIEHVYFPITGVVSLFAAMAGGPLVEVSTVGREGMVGVPVFLGAAAVPGRARCQIEGDSWRLPAATFQAETRRDGPFRDLLERYVAVYLDQLSQWAGCYRAHALEARCARWLLITHDRVEGDRFLLTQEFLASMLGVRRATVSAVMGAFRRAEMVRYTRGQVTILDRPRLEAASCSCYQVVNDCYVRLLAAPSAHP